MKSVNVHQAKTHLSKLLERAHAGEEVIIAKNGKPYGWFRCNPSRRESQDCSTESSVTSSSSLYPKTSWLPGNLDLDFLLDTHTLLGWLFDDPRLSRRARAVLADPKQRILVSAASVWEVSTKFRLGKLATASVLVQDLPGWKKRAGFQKLSVDLAQAQKAGSWPRTHRSVLAPTQLCSILR